MNSENYNHPTVPGVISNWIGREEVRVDIPIIDHLDARVLREVEKDPRLFDMRDYSLSSTCGTTHCFAGWVLELAGAQALPLIVRGYGVAAERIYKASCPGKQCPSFSGVSYVSNGKSFSDQLEDHNARHLDLLRQRAAFDPLPVD